MRKSGDFHYEWKLEWNGSCYRGWYHKLTWRDIWWFPLFIVAPVIPAYIVLGVIYLIHVI